MIFLSFISSSTVIAAPEQGSTTYRKFVIYYGWYSDHGGELGSEIERIIAAKPEFVISPYHTSTGQINLTPEVMDKFHENGVKVLVYVATGNGNRELEDVLKEIKTGLDSGADGVLLDEVAMLHSDWQVDYYKEIYEYTKSFGNERTVIANPGSILVNEKVMSVSDIVSFEHQWRLASQIDWFSKYPATRFMGISSNDIRDVMGYKVNEESSARDTIEAWQAGIGYHFSTNTYTTLAPWFEGYQKALEDYSASGTELRELQVRTVDREGNEIKGLWIEVKKNDREVITGFSPAKFLLPEGAYQVGASNYQSFIFDRWQDGETSPYHDVTVTNATGLVAVYKSELANLRVESYDNLRNSIKGMHVTVSGGEGVVAEGFTPLSLRLPVGNYSVAPSSYEYYEFDRWDDGSQVRETNLAGDAKISAYYDNMLADKLGAEIFSCQDYQQQVADSVLKSGPLAALLELQMRKSVMASAGCPVQ
jgi:spherulation-specific family 4 protein